MRSLLLASLISLAGVSQAAETEVRWNAKFRESYHSQAEGADVAFSVQSPPQVEGMTKYPLLIALSGGLRVAPSEQFPFFQANPTRTRIWGYRALSTYDAMQVVATMKRKYPIDPNRVYLMGFSAGGSGAMHLASCYPDEFAAVLPMVAAGNNYPLANFRNLPVAFHHGDRDWTSAICNARVQAQRMKEMGCPTLIKEYPGAGHSVPGPHAKLMTWLFEQRRNPLPELVTHACETPALGRAYWIRIREFVDPHQRASVKAAIKDGVISVEAENVMAFSLTTEAVAKAKSVRIGAETLPVKSDYRMTGGAWRAVQKLPPQAGRTYEAGAAANLYQGQPLLIVYGTIGERASQLRAAATRLAKYGGPDFSTMPGAIPVVADSELKPAQEANSNLILIGKPAENRLTQRLLPKFPIKLVDGKLLAGGREPLPLKNQVLSLLARNPNHPRRLVYLMAPFTDKSTLGRFVSAPQKFMAGSDGFDRISQADLLVQNIQHQIARQMQFDKNWNWIRFAGADKPVPARFADRSNLAFTYMEIMKAKSQTDYALWWGPEDKGMWGTDLNDLERYNPEFYREADYRTQNRHYETTIGSVSGADLKMIWNRWGASRVLQSTPQVVLDDLDDEREYRLHIPMDMYIKLGQRKKNLIAPVAGPRIPCAEVRAKVFQ